MAANGALKKVPKPHKRPREPKGGSVNPPSEKSEVKLDQETSREAMRGLKKMGFQRE